MIKKLETDVKSGEAPDLAQVGYAELPEVFTKGLLQDVTQYAEQYKNDFASGPYSLVQVGGKAYGLPQDTGPLVYFYNKAEFEKLGITEIPQTADEFIAAAKTAAAAGKYIMSYQLMSRQHDLRSGWRLRWLVQGEGRLLGRQHRDRCSKATADFYQQLLDAKAATTNRVGIRPSMHPSRMAR